VVSAIGAAWERQGVGGDQTCSPDPSFREALQAGLRSLDMLGLLSPRGRRDEKPSPDQSAVLEPSTRLRESTRNEFRQ
jgi:hypothetical protein